MLATGVAALYFANHDVASTLTRWAARVPLHPGNHWVDRVLAPLLSVDPRTLRAIGAGTFVYGAVFLTEGGGLLLRRRWAEYLTVIVTGSFLPLELYELVERVRITCALLVAVNLAIVLYLIARLRADRRRA